MKAAPSLIQRALGLKALALRSLRVRLLMGTLVGVALALVLAGVVLNDLFRSHVRDQFQASLAQQLDQVTARFTVDAQGQPGIASGSLSDPRWQQPYSGLYWQIDERPPDGDGPSHSAVRRSRSLWDSRLQVANDDLPDGAVHVHECTGPRDAHLLLLERTVQLDDQPHARWRLMVAADLKDTRAATDHFERMLGLSLLILFVLLSLATLAQLAIGLRPLRDLQRGLKQVQDAHAANLQGQYPLEVQPLVDDFNRVLDQNRAVVARARTQAGNLAHALKTPLAVLGQAASRQAPQREGDLAQVVQEQVATARRHIDWHLARARVSATHRLPGQRTDVIPTIEGLLRVMARVHADRGLSLALLADPSTKGASVYFAGEEQDLHEMLGNLLDNACKWAHSRVDVRLSVSAPSALPQLCIAIEDDGPGVEAAHLKHVMARGARLDEGVPGSGLGLAIVQELAQLYGGHLALQAGPTSGLRATLCLPAPPEPAR